jgi:hypothetical protein
MTKVRRYCIYCQKETDHSISHYNSYCRSCRSADQMRRNYNLTPVQRDQLYADQAGLCLICERELGPKPAIDHIHGTKIIRGLLCSACSTALSKFQENPTIVMRAARYLEWHAARLVGLAQATNPISG